MFPQLDFSKITTVSISNRQSKVAVGSFASPFEADGTFAAFIDSLPDFLKARDLRRLAAEIARFRKEGRPCIFMMGAHVVKVGLAPVVIDLMKRGVITAVAMNSAASIHDAESALFGVTSEDVAANLQNGTFGMWKETGEFINGVLTEAYRNAPYGYGEALGRALIAGDAPNARISILASAVELNIPVTVHAAIGTDIVHQQPTMDGAATGELSFRDFKALSFCVKDLDGGAVLNVGSAVILPEVFLKALTVARNLGYHTNNFVAANFDMIQQYRSNMNVINRPTMTGGKGYSFTGHHEIMIPLLAAMIKLSMNA